MAPVTIPERTKSATITGQNCWSNVLRNCGSIRVTNRLVCFMALRSIVSGGSVFLDPDFFAQVKSRQYKIPISGLVGPDDNRL